MVPDRGAHYHLSYSFSPRTRIIRIAKANINIKGFKVQNKEFKIAAYVDDLLFFLTSPVTSLPNLMKEFAHYGYVSNLKINYSNWKP